MKDFALSPGVLDVLCPMHLALGPTGLITHIGPTFAKLLDGHAVLGARMLEVFAVTRPHGVRTLEDVTGSAGGRLHLRLRQPPGTQFRGVAAPHAGGMILNLSFGISMIEDLRDFDLTSADFAPTDHAIEMLYLAEAKSLAMGALDALNERLQTSMVAVEEQAFTDTLTGLKNRRAMDHVMGRHIEWDRPFAVMQVDLDYFKSVNDTYGHAAGDHGLQAVARIMIDLTRGDDTVARVGGDEFVILLPGVHRQSALEQIGTRLITKIEEPVPFGGHQCRISASIGTRFFEPGSGQDMASLMDDVDIALYTSKRAGRGRQTFYTEALREAD